MSDAIPIGSILNAKKAAMDCLALAVETRSKLLADPIPSLAANKPCACRVAIAKIIAAATLSSPFADWKVCGNPMLEYIELLNLHPGQQFAVWKRTCRCGHEAAFAWLEAMTYGTAIVVERSKDEELSDVLRELDNGTGLDVHRVGEMIASESAALMAADATPGGEAAGAWADTLYVSVPDIVGRFPAINDEALRKRLTRWRRRNDGDWRELENRNPSESRFSYRWGAVRGIVKSLTRASVARPAR